MLIVSLNGAALGKGIGIGTTNDRVIAVVLHADAVSEESGVGALVAIPVGRSTIIARDDFDRTQ